MAIYKRGGRCFFDMHLQYYIAHGENEKAKCLLAGIENPCDLRDCAGETLLHVAARHGNAVMSNYLIDIGCKVDAESRYMLRPLSLAMKNAHVEIIEILLEAKADIYNSEHGECMLQLAYNSFMSKRTPVTTHEQIYKLFSKRLCEDFRENKKATAQKLFAANCSLHLGVTILRSPRLARYYAEMGYNLDTAEPFTQCTALHAAVGGSDFPSVEMLVRSGAYVNAYDATNRTPLFYYNCTTEDTDSKLEMLDYLCNHGALFNLPNSENHCTPLEYLLVNGSLKTVSIVLKHFINLRAKFRLDRTPLHFMAKNHSVGIMKLLEKVSRKNFEVDARDQQGYTVLMVAIRNNKDLSSVEYLLNNGADVNAENSGQTPLCYAVSNTFRTSNVPKVTFDICKLLLQRGANIQHVFKTYKNKKLFDPEVTIFDMILKNKQFEVSKLLLAQLAFNSEQGERITDLIRTKIQTNDILNEQFNICKEQIEKMKVAKINESSMMFDFMTADEDLMVHHAIDFEFMSKLDESMSSILQENCYYFVIIKERIVNIVNKLKFIKESGSANVNQPTCCIS